MDTINKLIRQRDRTLGLAALSFLLWQGAQLAQDIVRDQGWSGEPQDLIIQITLLVGAVGWAVASFLFLLYASKVSRTKSQSVIQDELFCHNQRIAIRTGFMVLIGAISLLLAADLLIDFSATIAIRALLIIGIFTPLATFVLLGRGGDGDEEEAA
ncbi:hypothetical protein [Maricaulis sp.]|uniref:hypothetical protein n=1 Tax=Maricaulis sp. TaxID=1486257 RepID=UPI002B270C38|nr:hypothetical protein [Maricaulis sp.]